MEKHTHMKMRRTIPGTINVKMLDIPYSHIISFFTYLQISFYYVLLCVLQSGVSAQTRTLESRFIRRRKTLKWLCDPLSYPIEKQLIFKMFKIKVFNNCNQKIFATVYYFDVEEICILSLLLCFKIYFRLIHLFQNSTL